MTGMKFPSYSETRWFSKYDVLEFLAKMFGDLPGVLAAIVKQKISPANSAKLLRMLLDKPQWLQLRIELAAYVEGLFELRNLCYYLEAETTDLPFKCGERIDSFMDMFAGGAMKPLPSCDRLINEVIAASASSCVFYSFGCADVVFCSSLLPRT